jgi:DNA primase
MCCSCRRSCGARGFNFVTNESSAPARAVNRQVLDELKQHIPLREYLEAHDWRPARALSGGRWMGLCPLHTDHKPSFPVDPKKGQFYCYG